MSKLATLAFGTFVTSLFIGLALAQGFSYPVSGACPPASMEFKGVCISEQIIEDLPTSEVISRLYEFQGSNVLPVDKVGSSKICMTKVEDDAGDVLTLANGAVVEVTLGYLGYLGYRKDALLFSQAGRWKIWIEGKKVFPVEVLKAPGSCRTPSSYRIQAAVDDEVFIVNGEAFEAHTYCMNWAEGEAVVFLGGSAHGTCSSASLFNLSRAETCDVWCK